MKHKKDFLKDYIDFKRKCEVNKILSNLPVMRRFFCPSCVDETIFIEASAGYGVHIYHC
jgi:hypothetical protein